MVCGAEGLIVMPVSVAAVTVKAAVPWWPEKVAVIVLMPAATPVARPVVLIVAAAVLDDCQVAEEVTFWLVPSE